MAIVGTKQKQIYNCAMQPENVEFMEIILTNIVLGGEVIIISNKCKQFNKIICKISNIRNYLKMYLNIKLGAVDKLENSQEGRSRLMW